MNTSREKFIKYFILDKIIRENKIKFKEEISSDNYYKYYKNNKICDSEIYKCFITKYQEADKLVSSDKKKYIKIVDDIVKLLDVGGYDEKSDKYKEYYNYVKKKIILLLEPAKESPLSNTVEDDKRIRLLDIYSSKGGEEGLDKKEKEDSEKEDSEKGEREKEEREKEDSEKEDSEKEEREKEEREKKIKQYEEEMKDINNKLIDFIEELTDINTELENQEKVVDNYNNISEKVDKKFKEFKDYNDKYLKQLKSRGSIYIYNDQIFDDIEENIIDIYLEFLKKYSENELDLSYLEYINNLNNQLLKVNLYFKKHDIKSEIYNKYEKFNKVFIDITKKVKGIKIDNNNENELIRYTGNITNNINEINNFVNLLSRENQQYNGIIQLANNNRPVIDNIRNIENNLNEIIKNTDNIYATIKEVKGLIKKSILLKNVSKNLKEYVEELNKVLKNMSKKSDNSDKSDKYIEKKTIYNKIWDAYIKNVSDSEKVLEDTQDKLYRQYNYNNLDPIKALTLTLNDKVIFIVICFCIRQIVLSIMGYMYDKNMINSFYLAIIYYVCFYIAIILIIVIVVNLDDYNLRIILNFFNINANVSGILTHVVIMIILSITIYHLAFLISPSIHKNYIKNEIIDDVSKYKIIYDIELTTISIFFLTSLVSLVL